MKFSKHISIAALLFTLAAPAAAQTPQFYIGVHAGKSLAVTELSNTASTFSLDGLGMSGYVAGVHTGLDLQPKDSPVFFGVFAGYDFQNTEFKVQFGPTSFNANLHNSWYAGGRTGAVIWGAKVYGLAAYRQSEMDTSIATLTSPTLKGFDLGMGIAIPIAKNVSLGIEGVHTRFQKVEFEFGGVPTGIHHELEQLTVMGRLNFTLGGNPLGVFDDRAEPPAPRARDPKIMGKP